MPVKSIKGLKLELEYWENNIRAMKKDLEYSKGHKTVHRRVYEQDLKHGIEKCEEEISHATYDLAILEAAQK